MIGRVLLAIIGLTLFGLACVWQHLQARELQYRITSVRSELQDEHRRRTRLRVRFEKLRSPERLRELRKRLGLTFQRDRSRGRTLTLTEMRALLKKKNRGYALVNRPSSR